MGSESVSPSVFIIILNWNGREHLEYCIPSVVATKYPNFRILLVDNGSLDDSVTFVRQKFPEVTVICNKRNLGYAKGNNVGIKYVLRQGADYIVILNSDMKVDSHWISEAIRVAQSNHRIGIVGFKVFGEYEKEDEGKFRWAQKHFSTISVKTDTFITGCALFIKSEVFRKIGLFDEGYFLYADEEDFELRTQRAGFTMVRINVPLWHKGVGSVKTKKAKIISTYYTFKSHFRLYFKNYSFGKALRMIGRLLFHVYFKKKEKKTWYYFQRLRSSNLFLSSTLFIFAVIATFFSVPEIINARRQSKI